MRIAVVSTDGKQVDDHFGRARRFLIYDRTAQGLDLVAIRASEPLSVGDPKHAFDQERMKQVLDVLQDCERVYMTRIGDRPVKELENFGIRPMVYEGPIEGIGGE